MNGLETARRVAAFGGQVTIHASGPGSDDAVERATSTIEAIHSTLTRFDPESELCRLNADPKTIVPVSPILSRFLEAVVFAAELSDGLVDATCLDAVERAGYVNSLSSPAGLQVRTSPAPPMPLPAGTWRDVVVDPAASTVSRPPGLRFDAGGLGKGMAADMAAECLCHLDSFAVECLGEIRFGGTSVGPREIQVASPEKDLGTLALANLTKGAVATSGITRRSWTQDDGRTSHHLVDPRSGEPVRSGVVQATALASTALEAEVRAKQALISGPDRAMGLLPDGGVIVLENGEVDVSAPFSTDGELP